MKKIMILGAGQYQMPIITRAKEFGLYTIAISPKGDYPGFAVADKSYYVDVKDMETVLEIAEKEGISGITTDQTDIPVRTEAYVSEKLGLPGISYECARIFTDKSLMRSKCEELGLRSIRCKASSDIKEVKEFFDSIGKTAILKPVDNQGSRGVYKVERRAEIDSLFGAAVGYSKSGKVIIEEFIEGQEYEVDSIVFDYKDQTLLYGDVIPFDIPGVFAAKVRMYPSASDSVIVDRLLKYNSDIVRGFGLKQGITHSEYIVDADGQPYLLEAAARGGGGFISSHIVRLHTGIDTATYLIKLALGEITEAPVVEELPNVCCYVSFFLPEGIVTSVEGIEEVKALPYLHAHSLNDITIGKKTAPFSDKTHRYVNVLTADTREELYRRIDDFKKTLKIVVQTEDGPKGPVWD
ncbi:MAG: ATP-grasp domain-containing protein [Mogibacterium sp.]|nr:ATP-grasp domain-containing protein [Mogibacterium sp.]